MLKERGRRSVVEQTLLLFYFSDWLDRSEAAAVVLDGYQQAGRQTDRLAVTSLVAVGIG